MDQIVDGSSSFSLQSFPKSAEDDSIHKIIGHRTEDDSATFDIQREEGILGIEDLDVLGRIVANGVASLDVDPIVVVDDTCTNVDSDRKEFEGEKIIGRFFECYEDAYAFYNRYALLKGFDTHIRNHHRVRFTNEKFRGHIVCNKQGYKKKLMGRIKNIKDKRGRDVRRCSESQDKKMSNGSWTSSMTGLVAADSGVLLCYQ